MHFIHLIETATLKTNAASALVGIWSLLMIWFSVRTGSQHDYNAYLSQWTLVLAGADPWSTTNAYGPLHNLLAYLLPFGPLGPKLFIVSALIAANALLFHELARTSKNVSSYILYFLAVPTNIL